MELGTWILVCNLELGTWNLVCNLKETVNTNLSRELNAGAVNPTEEFKQEYIAFYKSQSEELSKLVRDYAILLKK